MHQASNEKPSGAVLEVVMIEVAVGVVVVATMVVVDIALAIILKLGRVCATFSVP